MKNPAHELLMLIGLGHLCGVWEKTKRYRGPTRSTSGKTKQQRRDAKSATVAIVLRDYFTRKNLERLQAKKL